MVQSAISYYIALFILNSTKQHCIVLIILMKVYCILNYVMFDISIITCMAGWIEIEIIPLVI